MQKLSEFLFPRIPAVAQAVARPFFVKRERLVPGFGELYATATAFWPPRDVSTSGFTWSEPADHALSCRTFPCVWRLCRAQAGFSTIKTSSSTLPGPSAIFCAPQSAIANAAKVNLRIF